MHKNSLQVLVGVSLGILIAELTLALTNLAPQLSTTSFERYRLSPNPLIVYEPTDGFKLGVDTSNSLGYRGPEYQLERSEGVFRIVNIGDSVSEGLLIADYKQTFPSVLERTLSELLGAVEVINFGVNGYNTLQEVETFKDKGLSFNPDLILLQYALNDDRGDDGGIGTQIVQRGKDVGQVERNWSSGILIHSALYRFLRFRVLEDQRWEKFWKISQNVRRNRVAEAFAELERVSGNKCVLVVIFPWFDKGLDNYPYTEQHARVAELADKHGFLFLDLLPAFQHCAKPNSDYAQPLYLDHVHPSVSGHECAGKAIAEFFVSSDLQLRCPE